MILCSYQRNLIFWRKIRVAMEHRQFTGEWTILVNEMLKKVNPYCVWIFKGHYIKSENSRKTSPFFRCEAKCKIPCCTSKIKVLVVNEGDSKAKIIQSGRVNHPTGSTAARQIKGKTRQQIKENITKDINVAPSKLYRDRLLEIPHDVYASGNRNRSASKKVFQNMKSEVKCGLNDLNNIHKGLLDMQIKMKAEDEQEALSLNYGFRRLFGYIQQISISCDEIKHNFCLLKEWSDFSSVVSERYHLF